METPSVPANSTFAERAAARGATKVVSAGQAVGKTTDPDPEVDEDTTAKRPEPSVPNHPPPSERGKPARS